MNIRNFSRKHPVMNRNTALLILIAMMSTALATPREGTEWTNVWIPNADRTDRPRVLLVGDSITQGYGEGVSGSLAGKAYVARLTTSLCVCDPAFEPALRSVLAQAQFSVIHFNNGLHGVDFTEEQVRAGYEKTLKLLAELQPRAKVIVALSTPLKAGSPKDALNPRIARRNADAKSLAEAAGLPVNDLHRLMSGHPDYYRDPYHFHPPAIRILEQAVTTAVLDALSKPTPTTRNP